jgi:Fe-S-cluster containining protein
MNVNSDIFSFCTHCKAAYKCCEQLGESSDLNAPIIMNDELQNIKESLGELFLTCIEDAEDKKVTTIRTRTSGSCVFRENGQCNIYDHRPFDCMIFPLDIFRIDNQFYWIIYETFCEQEIDHEGVLAYGESLLSKRGYAMLDQYACDINKRPPRLVYKILKKIYTECNRIVD